MSIGEIKSILESDYQKYKQTFFIAVASDSDFLNKINEFILQKNGKELRPQLSLLASRICGEPNTVSYKVAAASQIIHNATLMHDDVVDMAQTRRGTPTVAAQYHPGAAVLMGDFWLSRALSLVAQSVNSEIIEVFSRAVAQMSESELIQMDRAERVDTTLSDYYKIIEGKTSALFIASMVGGALSVGADKVQVDALADYARHLGNAFQIRDDILDYMPAQKTGKPCGLDLKEKKITLPLLCTFRSDNLTERYLRTIIRELPYEDICDEVLKYVRDSNGVALAQDELLVESKRAVDALKVFNDSPEKEALLYLSDYVGRREM